MEQQDRKLKTEKKILNLSLAGSILFLLAEIFFAIYTGSKAVLMDCVYDIADLVMIGPFILLVPLLYKPTTKRRPYGFAQVESLFVLIKYCILLGVDVVLVLNCVKSILSGGNEVDASVLAAFEIAVSAGCVIMYLVLNRFQKKYSSPSIKAELFIWKLDALSTLGVGCAFLINLLLMRTPLSFICPYVDPGIAIILAVILVREPIEMIFDSLRSLVLFAPDDEIREKVKASCEDILGREGCEITDIDIIKTGRKVWAEIYFLPAGNVVDLVKLKAMHKEIIAKAREQFDSVYIDLLPDMEEYHVLAPDEITARREDLIKYLDEREQKKEKKKTKTK
ncbi:MAG: cation diffusion facilitator family transporter [Bacillota bacterium]|nr:cation diffusion facilitator family transporter [Bacillota bacterium]